MNFLLCPSCLRPPWWTDSSAQDTLVLKSSSTIKPVISCLVLQVAMMPEAPHPFPTVDVPDHAHYTIGSVILAIGITGIVGNFLVIYAFCR